MKFSIPANVFNEAATFAAKSISARPTSPIMGGLLIDVQADGIRLAGSSLEETSRTYIDADISSPGLVVLPAGMLISVLGKLRNRTCTVERVGDAVHIGAGSANFNLHCMPEKEYPALGKIPAMAGTVDGAALAHAMAMVSGAATTDDTLPILTGVNIQTDGDTLILTATDRYRLAMTTLPWAPTTTTEFSALVKAPWIQGLTKNLEGRVEFQHDGSQVGLDTGQRSSVASIIGGDYPKIRTLFPDSCYAEAIIDRAVFAEAVDRVATVAERNTPIRLRFANDTITMDAGTGEVSQGEETIECDYQGDPATAAFNPGYLGWSISTLATEKISLQFQQNMAKPVLILPTVGEAKHLIMPVRLPQVA